MFHKKLLKNLDMILLWIWLFYELKELSFFLQDNSTISFCDIVCRMWFLILILIVYRLYKKENFFHIIRDEFSFPPKNERIEK